VIDGGAAHPVSSAAGGSVSTLPGTEDDLCSDSGHLSFRMEVNGL